MGLYCEPKGSKLQWINAVGAVASEEELLSHFDESRDTLPVVYLEQGFDALGVAYDRKELQRFVRGRPDGRWFLVSKAELRKVVPGGNKLRELR